MPQSNLIDRSVILINIRGMAFHCFVDPRAAPDPLAAAISVLALEIAQLSQAVATLLVATSEIHPPEPPSAFAGALGQSEQLRLALVSIATMAKGIQLQPIAMPDDDTQPIDPSSVE